MIKDASGNSSDSYQGVLMEINKLITPVKKLAQKAVRSIQPEITAIISSESNDVQRIEQLLDTLVSCGQVGVGESQFKQLVDYYATLDPAGAEDYRKYYLGLD